MKKVDELTLEEKIGQLLMIGLRKIDKEQAEKLIIEQKIGGIVIYKTNYNNYYEMISFINDLKESNSKNSVPLFVTIDQEGGRVNRMPNEICNLRGATKIAETKDTELVKRSGKTIGKMLKQIGISMNYAPILDIKRFKEQHAIGNRCYGENKEEVIKYGIEVMQEMQEEGIISVVKHFPGHGLTKKDSHYLIPRIAKPIEAIEKEDMKPFEEAIKHGADAVMVGHLIIKDIDKKYPASLSKKIIQKYLVERNNYKGLIITDDLKMFAIRLRYSMKYAAFKAIEAGNDIVMMGNSSKKVKRIIKYIAKKVRKGIISEERINKSVEKIIAMKAKYEVNDNKVKGFDITEINKVIQNINEEVNKKISC